MPAESRGDVGGAGVIGSADIASSVSSLAERIGRRVGRTLLKTVPRQSRRDLTRLGSGYGGWVVPASLLSESSVAYCAGVGEDITFDLALIEAFSCEVFAFDPTPRAVRYVAQNGTLSPNFHFSEVGLWAADNPRVRFYAPKDPRHVSHSIVNLQDTSEFFEAECKRLSTLMRELGHRRLDLLKLDIEGAEYDVLDTMLEDEIPVRVLCVEFDQPTPYGRIWRQVWRLWRRGYSLVCVDNNNYTFVNGSTPW